LLKLPLMPELKALPPGAIKGFTAAAIDLETIKYSDKIREKARVARLTARKEERAKEVLEEMQRKTKVKDTKHALTDQKKSSDNDSDLGGGDSSADEFSDSSSESSSKNLQPVSAVKRKRKGHKKVGAHFADSPWLGLNVNAH
jgi:hypothetical protein